MTQKEFNGNDEIVGINLTLEERKLILESPIHIHRGNWQRFRVRGEEGAAPEAEEAEAMTTDIVTLGTARPFDLPRIVSASAMKAMDEVTCSLSPLSVDP